MPRMTKKLLREHKLAAMKRLKELEEMTGPQIDEEFHRIMSGVKLKDHSLQEVFSFLARDVLDKMIPDLWIH